ncbi:MAG TPA: DUF4190 domain-containing protein [Candidatus Nanoarchaeia archaeon]|nr:DUF4190 domain-containing protein [Candidatus Nanoarchaeia archaeon]
MAEKKEDTGNSSYVLGIISIVFAFFSPLAGLILGVVGFNLSKGQAGMLAKRGKKLSQIGIVISIIVLIVTIVVAIIASENPELLGNFPIN